MICYTSTIRLHSLLVLQYVYNCLSLTTYSHNSTLIRHSCFSLLMSIESAKILRNGKVLSNSLPETSSIDANNIPNLNMESSNNFSEEITQSGRKSPTNEDHTQTANEERFNRLQDEMSILKSLMEKIISHNEERNKQNGGSFATSSYAVGTSNRVTGVNRTHRN